MYVPCTYNHLVIVSRGQVNAVFYDAAYGCTIHWYL